MYKTDSQTRIQLAAVGNLIDELDIGETKLEPLCMSIAKLLVIAEQEAKERRCKNE